MKFKVGDRVKTIKNFPEGEEGKVVFISGKSYAVKFDNWHNGHSCSSHRSKGCPDTGDQGYWLEEEDIELIESIETFAPNKNAKDKSYIPEITVEEIERVYKDCRRGYIGTLCGIKVYKKDNLIKKTMSNIVKFAKDLTLSADEKELRKAGLQDENGNWTEEAKNIIRDLIAKEAGFKNKEEAISKYNCTEGFSFMEWHIAYIKYKTELIEIAKKYNEENKAK